MRLSPPAAAQHPGAGGQRERIPATPREPRTLRETGVPRRVGAAEKKKRASAVPTGKAEMQPPCRGSATSPREPGGCCGARRTFAPRRCSGPPRSGPPGTEGGGGPARGELTFTCRAPAREANAEQQQQRQQAPQAPAGEGGRHGAPAALTPAALPWLGPAAPPEEASKRAGAALRKGRLLQQRRGAKKQSKAAPNSLGGKNKRPKKTAVEGASTTAVPLHGRICSAVGPPRFKWRRKGGGAHRWLIGPRPWRLSRVGDPRGSGRLTGQVGARGRELFVAQRGSGCRTTCAGAALGGKRLWQGLPGEDCRGQS